MLTFSLDYFTTSGHAFLQAHSNRNDFAISNQEIVARQDTVCFTCPEFEPLEKDGLRAFNGLSFDGRESGNGLRVRFGLIGLVGVLELEVWTKQMGGSADPSGMDERVSHGGGGGALPPQP